MPRSGGRAISHNTALHRVVGIGVRPLVNTRVTPNQLTAARLLTGIGAACALAVGEPSWRVAGAVLFVFSLLLDRADGMLARLRGVETEFGHRFDLFSDSACNALVFVGLGIGLRGSALGGWAIPMGFAAGGAVVWILFQVVQMEAMDGARAGELSGAAGFDPDDGILAVPIGVLLGFSVPLLALAAIVAPVFALIHQRILRTKARRLAGAASASDPSASVSDPSASA